MDNLTKELIDGIADMVCEKLGADKSVIWEYKQTPSQTFVRYIFAYVAHESGFTYWEIARFMGLKDAANVAGLIEYHHKKLDTLYRYKMMWERVKDFKKAS